MDHEDSLALSDLITGGYLALSHLQFLGLYAFALIISSHGLAVVICALSPCFFNWFSPFVIWYFVELTRTIYNTLAVLSHPNSSLLWLLLMFCTTIYLSIYL